MTGRNWLLLLLMLPGLLGALLLAGQRYGIESQSKTVELTLDYAELQNLSVASGTPLPALLREFKSAGITGVAISEQVLGDLAATGQVSYEERSSDAGPLTVIRVPNRRLSEQVLRLVSVRLSPGMVSPDASMPESSGGRTPDTFVVRAAPLTLNGMGIGLPHDAVRLVKRSGLDVVARLQNHPALTSEAVTAAVSDLKRDGIKRVICAGEEVLGFRGLIPFAARSFRSAGLVYGSVEFAHQKGDARMSRELDSELIRVHSISNAEMAGMAPSTAVERFARAVKERNIRLCYVRLLESSGESSVKTNVAFVSAVRSALEDSGYHTGRAVPFQNSNQSVILLLLVALSVAAGAVLLLGSLVTMSAGLQIGLLAAGFIALGGLTLSGETGKQLTALAAALTFPTLGIIRAIGPHFGPDSSGGRRPGLYASGILLHASSFTLMGALLIAGLLGTRPYMVKVEQFAGVKVAHLLPILAVVFIMAAGLPLLGQPLSQVRRKVEANLRELASNPLFVWQAVTVALILGIIGFALLRTGNEPGIGVTGLELKIRAILDKVTAVRPRTKEFLVGHPALFVGAAFLLTRRRAWGLPLAALGVLGQVSLLNTFCHIHTPLTISMLRAANGLVLGLVIGWAAWLMAGRRIGSSAPPPPTGQADKV